jgi:proteasome lid subunit RPN8/RPN11
MASRGDSLRQRNSKPGPPPPLQIGKPFPDDHAILWAPVEGLARSMELSQPAIVIAQGALREVIRHLSSNPEAELLGFLIGEPCECPKTKRRFLCITGTLRTGHTIAEDEPVQIPDAEWLGQQLEVRRRRTTLIGWYHSTPYLSPAPATLDLESHRARFTEAWQCGLVIATEGNEPAGGFFRAHADPAAGGAYVPFYEQVEDDGILEGGRFRTLIDWTSYSTSELVERDVDERSVHLAGTGRRADPEATPTALPLMIPSPADDAVRSAPVRSRWVGAGISAAIALAITVVAVLIWNSRRLPEPPMTASVAPPRARELVVVPNASALAAQKQMDSLAAAAVASVVPNAGQTGGAARDTTTVVPTAGTTPPSAPPSAPSATTVTAPVPAEIRMAAQSSFDSLADSLEHSLHNYRDRRTDFEQKRLSCKELSYGYRAADEALVGLAKLAGDTRTLDPERKARYAQLISGMDTVNDDFDSSKCKRL